MPRKRKSENEEQHRERLLAGAEQRHQCDAAAERALGAMVKRSIELHGP
jgi:hypothetical protein